jgi:type VI secretion system secreted protein VgrG
MANTQDNRLAAINTALGKDVLLLESFSGTEGVSELFRFEVRLLADVTRTIDFDAIVGKAVTVRVFTPNGERFFNGLVSRFSEGSSDSTFTTYYAEIVPWLWMLTQTADCRIFQDKSVPDIISQIFKDLGFTDFALHLNKSYAPREYCVQYRETDFNFVTRLMEQYGIFYYFEHENAKHTLVLADTPAAHQPCPLQPKARFHAEAGTLTEHIVTDWRLEQSVRPGKYALTDYNFEMPSVSLAVNVASSVGVPSLEIYDYPGEYQKRADGESLVRTRIEEEECQRVLVAGSGTCAGFTPGYKFDLLEHPRQTNNKSYVLTRVAHQAQEPGYRSETAEFSYENRFTCIPAAVPFRPTRRTLRPVVEGVQTAEVVGVAGEEIYTDKYGRVKVQFHWDREGKKDENSSCWIRVSHPWAGKGWGSVSIPRIGQEVVVDFLEGDPDQPIITGRVYNADRMPPYALPAGGVVSGLKTNSTKGGGGYNEMSMDDTKGKEKITIHAQYDMGTTVEHDDTQSVINNRTISVDGTHTEKIKKDTSIEITEGNLSHTVTTGTGTFKVKGAVDETYEATQTTTVTKEIVIKSGTAHVHVSGETEVKLSSGSAFILIKNTGEIQIHGAKVEMIGTSEAKMGVGSQNVTCNPQKVQTGGAAISSSAVGVHEISGAMVKLN